MHDPVRRFAWVGLALMLAFASCSLRVSYHLGAEGGRLIERAYAMVEKGQYETAVRSLEEAVARNPGDADLHDALADVLEAMGCQEKALEHRILCAEKSSNPEAKRELAQAYAAAQRYDRAIEVLNQCVELGGASEAVYRFLAFCYDRVGAEAKANDARALADSLADERRGRHVRSPMMELKQYM